jgi:photosystem II stability/assembly factor-like uncharacterized protein
MISTHARAAAPSAAVRAAHFMPTMGCAAQASAAEAGFGQTLKRQGAPRRHRLHLTALVAGCLFSALAGGGAHAAPAPTAQETAQVDTDTPNWRATHGLLLGLARAGTRLVAVGTGGNIMLSDDEGQSWRPAKAPTDELLTSVIFPTSGEGWAVGQDELVLHSTDAGETWTQQHIAANADQTMFSIISLGGTHLMATGAYNLTLESWDGAAWKDGKVPDTDDDYHLNCAVARGGDVLVTGESGHAFIRYAGAWTPMKLPYDGSQFACLVGPDGSFWSFGLRGSAFKSEAGSTQWTRVDTGSAYSIFGATNLADGRMALVGANGLMLLLDPANGKTSALRPVTDKALSAVVEGQGGKLIVVGEDGVHLIDPSAVQAGDDQ